MGFLSILYQALIKGRKLGLLGPLKVLQAVPLLELTLGDSTCRPLTVLRALQTEFVLVGLRVE